MKLQLIQTLTGSSSSTAPTVDVTALKTPFTRGRECVAVMLASTDYDATSAALANLTPGSTGTYTDIVAAVAFTAELIQIAPIDELGDTLKISQVGGTAGTCKVYLLGDT